MMQKLRSCSCLVLDGCGACASGIAGMFSPGLAQWKLDYLEDLLAALAIADFLFAAELA
jgi:hypothetical protein